jgi:uncharacterized membrane protein YkvA (DUF1232 family)
MRFLRILFAAKTSVLRTIPLLRDARVPLAPKALAIVAALAIVSPIDIFGDIPVLGALDDVALLTLLCMIFVRFAGRYVMEPVLAAEVRVGRSRGLQPPALTT